MDYEGYEFLKIELDDEGILTITLNRPERLNATHPPMLDELERVFHDVNRDPAVHVVVLTGAGRAFCAGGDIKAMSDRNTGDEDHAWAIPKPGRHDIIRGLLALEPPIIAAVNGAAVGVGATLALFCDIVIAADTARIGDSHIKLGMVPGDGGTVIFSHLLGLPKAKQLLLTGDLVDAAEAERIGLISEAVPGDQLMERVYDLARRIAANPRLAVRWTKMSLNRRLEEEVLLGQAPASALEWLSLQMEDHQGGDQGLRGRPAPAVHRVADGRRLGRQTAGRRSSMPSSARMLRNHSMTSGW